ncbi:MAG: 50S ribosomal protein L11 [Candidatus Micrarchaeota archaeon]|nr:50S ribosomal protein L11 [Candidatus Micrarchaeota archaeon]
MSEMIIPTIVEGGKAVAGASLGPALGSTGMNISAIIADVNKQTAMFAGIKVPIKIIVNKEAKTYRLEIGAPATGELIKKELGIEKGRKGGPDDPKTVGDLPFDKVVSIAKAKMGKSLTKTVKASVSEVLGTCVSLGVQVDGKDPRAVYAEVQAGKMDSLLSG